LNSFDATCESAWEGAANEAYFGSNRLLAAGQFRPAAHRACVSGQDAGALVQGLATPRAAKAGSLRAYRSVVALYDSSTKTIYLSKNWSSQTPSEMSILVHETSEKLDAFELRVLRFARETVRYA
jgi:hypothetical protein